MNDLNRSPAFWLVLAIAFTATFAVKLWEHDVALTIDQVPIIIAAVLSFFLALYFKNKENQDKK